MSSLPLAAAFFCSIVGNAKIMDIQAHRGFSAKDDPNPAGTIILHSHILVSHATPSVTCETTSFLEAGILAISCACNCCILSFFLQAPTASIHFY